MTAVRSPALNLAPALSLDSGDRLTRDEFHQRYCTRTDIKKAELIQGVVYVASPLRTAQHGIPHATVIGWLFAYVSPHAGLRVSDNATVFLGPDSEVQPDACLIATPTRGGNARLTDDGYITGAPELVVEIAASSASYDLHDKLEAYREAGVPEYIVWRTVDQAFDWFELHDGIYVRREPDAKGVIESRLFPGLRLNVTKLLAGDNTGVLAELRRPSRQRARRTAES